MENTVKSIQLRRNIPAFAISVLALLCVYFIPTLSHLTGIPFYLFEPMRIFIILALLHTNRTNAYILAFTLPLFSFAIASHPVFLKSLIISVELVLNVLFYYLLVQRKTPGYLAVLLSIAGSKIIYYLLKFLLINFVMFESTLISTPLYIQGLTTLAMVIYSFIVLNVPLILRKSR
jgi:hypothetical protein